VASRAGSISPAPPAIFLRSSSFRAGIQATKIRTSNFHQKSPPQADFFALRRVYIFCNREVYRYTDVTSGCTQSVYGTPLTIVVFREQTP
jgi:ribosomal protein S19E (S16A)